MRHFKVRARHQIGIDGFSTNLLGKVSEARTRGFVTNIEELADVVTLGIRVRRRKNRGVALEYVLMLVALE